MDLLAGAETVYTDGSYKVVGTLLQRIRRTALYQASASIVAKGYDGSYKALLFDLTGRVDSAATAELVGAAGTGHRDQVMDCKSILAIEARARAARSSSFSASCFQVLTPCSTLSDGIRPTRRRGMRRGQRTTTACIWRVV